MPDPFGKMRSQVRSMLMLLFLIFLSGFAVQKLVVFVYALGAIILIKLAAAAVLHWLRR